MCENVLSIIIVKLYGSQAGWFAYGVRIMHIPWLVGLALSG